MPQKFTCPKPVQKLTGILLPIADKGRADSGSDMERDG